MSNKDIARQALIDVNNTTDNHIKALVGIARLYKSGELTIEEYMLQLELMYDINATELESIYDAYDETKTKTNK